MDERFFKLHNFWFFATREGATVGPFDSKECADRAVGDFMGFAKQADEETLAFYPRRTERVLTHRRGHRTSIPHSAI